MKKPRVKSLRQVWSDYKAGSKRRNIFFDLTQEQVDEITKKDCHYCGRPPQKSTRKIPRQKYPINGLDRKNNSKGYTVSNVVPCCPSCNSVKSNLFSEKQMLLIGQVLRKLRGG